jgi:hypothetical protein
MPGQSSRPPTAGARAYVRRYYDRDWADRRLYHMMINSCMGCDAMIEAVLDGAGMSALREQVAAAPA